MAYTLSEIQVDIAVDFDSSSSAPSTTNTEWARRLKLINRAEKQWQKAMHGRWAELYKQTTLATVSGTSTVDLPVDFTMNNAVLSGDGHLKVGTIWYKVVHVGDIDNEESEERLVWVTGNDAQGFQLNIQPTPTAIDSIPLRYYTTYLATDTSGVDKRVMTDPTDITKIPDPTYLSLYTLGQLYKDDDEGNKGVDFESQAISILNQMIGSASIGQQGQDEEIGHVSYDAGYAGIGW